MGWAFPAAPVLDLWAVDDFKEAFRGIVGTLLGERRNHRP